MIENEFQLFHTYNRLVREGKALPLLCPCGNLLVTRLGKGDRLYLWCSTENTWTRPGGNFLARVQGVVEEWIL
jgi:hypothetical protein